MKRLKVNLNTTNIIDPEYKNGEHRSSQFFPEVDENLENQIKYKEDKNIKYIGASLLKPDVGVKPLDGDDELIYSNTESVGPYSFAD